MNYEQKYNEAFERAKKLKETCDSTVVIGWCEYIFPELKKPDDERIRKAIHIYLDWLDGRKDYAPKGEYSIRDMIAWLEKQGKQSSNILWHDVSEEPEARREIFCEWKSSTGIWHSIVFYHPYSKTFCEGERIVKNVLKWTYVNEMLEKQGEQKPVDKVESIFEVGNWVVANEKKYTFLVKKGAPHYQVEDTDGDIYSFYLLPNGEEEYHLWTIEDAKDGDVLRLGCVIAIFKSIFKNSIGNPKCICYCSFCEEGNGFEIPIENGEDNVYGCIDTTPATKEQRDLLFTKMREAGYTWDADKKELIKL